jgi:hypothetical protein
MSCLSFSPQDIIQGIALAKRICEAHFVQERRAGKLKPSSFDAAGKVFRSFPEPVSQYRRCQTLGKT